MSGRSGWGGWPPQPIPGTAASAAAPQQDDDTARDTIETAESARRGADDTPWQPPLPPPTPVPEEGHPIG